MEQAEQNKRPRNNNPNNSNDRRRSGNSRNSRSSASKDDSSDPRKSQRRPQGRGFRQRNEPHVPRHKRLTERENRYFEKDGMPDERVIDPRVKNIGRISIIVPVYNEEKAISPVLEDIRRSMEEVSLTNYEIIVVDDGSEDNTRQEVGRHRGVRVLTHPERRGYGRALKTGIEKAGSDNIVIIDGDRSYPANRIPHLLEYYLDYDMAVGARRGAIPAARRPAKWVLNRIANYLAGEKIPDLNSGLRVFNRESVRRFWTILPNGFSFTTTITLAFICNGFSLKYMPIDYNPRSGTSKIRPISDTTNIFMLILRTIVYFNPLKVFMPLGMLLILAGVVVAVGTKLLLDQMMDVTSVILIVTGIQVMATGLLADAIAKKPR